jgi:hypothetical protein
VFVIFGGVCTCHKSDIEGRKPDSKIAWSFDPYGFPYLLFRPGNPSPQLERKMAR